VRVVTGLLVGKVGRCPLGVRCGCSLAPRSDLCERLGIIACSLCVTADLEVRWPLLQLRLWVSSSAVVLSL